MMALSATAAGPVTTHKHGWRGWLILCCCLWWYLDPFSATVGNKWDQNSLLLPFAVSLLLVSRGSNSIAPALTGLLWVLVTSFGNLAQQLGTGSFSFSGWPSKNFWKWSWLLELWCILLVLPHEVWIRLGLALQEILDNACLCSQLSSLGVAQ